MYNIAGLYTQKKLSFIRVEKKAIALENKREDLD